jgi:hypothetical protein
MKKKPTYIVYYGFDEIIVTTLGNEKKTIKTYFTEGGRDLNDFDREERYDEAVSISSRVLLD